MYPSMLAVLLGIQRGQDSDPEFGTMSTSVVEITSRSASSSRGIPRRDEERSATMGVHQVTPRKTWPSGDSRPIAVLPYEPPELSQLYGLSFKDGIDDLDRYKLAAIELPNGGQAWIYKHQSDPNPGTVVHVDAASDIEDALSGIAEALGIERSQFLWTAPLTMLVGKRR
jgi:hypothetical protein